MGRRKGSYKVNAPYIKHVHLKNATLRHFMSLGNLPHSLPSITTHDKFPCIFEESGPTETHLEYLCNSFVCAKVSTVSQSMTMV